MINFIQINNFRNYELSRIDNLTRIVVLYGANGSGKTNILEAISLLSYGRGLRNAQYESMINNKTDQNFWSITVRFGSHKLLSTYTKENKVGRRTFKIDDKQSRKIDEFAQNYYVLWLTYETDRIFMQSPSVRRNFIDVMCYSLFPNHEELINQYDKVSRERQKLLAARFDNTSSSHKYSSDKWLDIIEEKIVTCGLDIIKNRLETINIIQNHQTDFTDFPNFDTKMIGPIENYMQSNNAVTSEEIKRYYAETLSGSREKDYYTKSASVGPNKSDWSVMYRKKNVNAALCSAGEQKMMLVAVFLSFMNYKLSSDHRDMILLLDDVTTHLDDAHRNSLFEILKHASTSTDKMQIWLSGVRRDIFETFNDNMCNTTFINLENQDCNTRIATDKES